MSRSLLAALVAAFVAIVPAAARAQDGPTLTFDKPCYAEGDPMAYSGAGFTAGGEVNFLFSTLSSSRVFIPFVPKPPRRCSRYSVS